MAVYAGPEISNSGLVLSYDAGNYKSFKGEVTTNLIPSPTVNAYPTTGNGWGSYNVNQYNGNTYFSIGTINNVTNNIVTTNTAHPLRTYDVVTPQTTGGGVTAGTNYFVKKISNTSFSLHAYNSSQDGSQGYINSVTQTHKVYDSIANDTRISINSTSFPTMWWGPPHLPNSGLVKELRYGEFNAIPNLPANDCIRLHYIRTDDVKDGMSYGVDCTVTPSSPVTVSFYTRSANANAVGKVIQYYIYNYSGGNPVDYSWNFTLGPVGVWQRQSFTYTPVNQIMISYWFPQSGGVYSWDWSCMQVEQKSYATAFVAGTRGSTVATGGGLVDLTGNNNHGQLVNDPTYNSSNSGSLVFNGTNQYVSVTNSSTINPNTGSFTIIVWANSDPSNGGDGWDLWVAKRLNGNNGYYIGANNPLGVKFMIGNDANSRTDTGFVTYTYNTWAMYTAILDRTANTQIIIKNNYQETSSATPSGGNYYNTGPLSIGGDIGINAYYVNGRVPIVQMYNRALSSTEVQQTFNALRGRYGI